MRLRHIYLFLFILGVVLPYWYFVPWFLENGLNVRLFFAELFANRISASFGMDITVSTVVLLLFATFETLRLKMRRAWFVIALVFLGTFGAGVSSGFPLFLYLRQKHLDE
jgi:hypothetical protein